MSGETYIGNMDLVRERLNEYLLMLAPLKRAADEVSMSQKMLRAKTEEEIHEIAPALGALSDALNVSAIDILLAGDQIAFVHEAVERSPLTIEEIRIRLLEASSTAKEELKLLGFGDGLG